VIVCVEYGRIQGRKGTLPVILAWQCLESVLCSPNADLCCSVIENFFGRNQWSKEEMSFLAIWKVFNEEKIYVSESTIDGVKDYFASFWEKYWKLS
jgi:hypothetical protein